MSYPPVYGGGPYGSGEASMSSLIDDLLATGVAGSAWLVEFDFADGTQYATTWPTNVDAAGHTYIGLGQNLQIGVVTESEDTNAAKLEISLPLVNTTLLPLVIGDVPSYRGRRVRLYLQLFDATFAPVQSRVPRWQGRMDPVRIDRKASAQGASSGRVVLPCVRSGMPRARTYQGLRHTHAQQLSRYPGNLVLQYMQGLIEQPAVWLSKRFQELP